MWEYLKEKIEKLNTSAMKLGEAMYADAQKEQNVNENSSAPEDAKESDADVVDADFEDVSENNKKN